MKVLDMHYFLNNEGYTNKPSSIDEIHEVMERYNVNFSDEFISMFRYISGNDDLIIGPYSLYGLNNISRVKDFSKAYQEEDENIFIFCDCAAFCWGYALDVTKNGADILLIENNEPLKKIENNLIFFLEEVIYNQKIII